MPESELPFFKSVGSQLVVHAQYHPRAGEGACSRYLTFFPPSTLFIHSSVSSLHFQRSLGWISVPSYASPNQSVISLMTSVYPLPKIFDIGIRFENFNSRRPFRSTFHKSRRRAFHIKSNRPGSANISPAGRQALFKFQQSPHHNLLS